MSEVFFVSDTHFGHKGIINFESTKPFRPFGTIEEHDAHLIDEWNKTVGHRDTVYHLGDFCFGRDNVRIAGMLNGDKRLIMGNHDAYGAEEYLKYFKRVFGCLEYKGMVLSHIPVHINQFKRFYLNIHGHLHTHHVLKENGGRDGRYFNACVENHRLAPVPLSEIYEYWAEYNKQH